MNRAMFQKEMTVALMRNSAGSTRKRSHDFNNTNSLITRSEHNWMKLEKLIYCTFCRVNKNFTSGAGKGVKRRALQELDGNDNSKKSRLRIVQTWYECTSEQCKGRAACKNEACWKALHAQGGEEEGEEKGSFIDL